MEQLDLSSIQVGYLLIGVFAIPLLFPFARRCIRSTMNQTKITKKMVSMSDSIFSEKWLPLVGGVFFLIIFFGLFSLQKTFNITFIDANNSEFKLMDIYGFVIGILSMYGIYIGFLQFIIGDSEKVRYLGKNKLKYLTDTSLWYQITQTKSFLVTLFLLIVLPILIINTYGEFQSDLLYTWQTILSMLLCIYIFLIGMSLQILRILYLIKEEVDYGLEYNIKISIENKFYEQFSRMYRFGFDSDKIKNFFRVVEYDLQRVNKREISEFLITVFSKIEKNISYSFGKFKKVRKVKLNYGTREQFLYNDYKSFVNKKWEFITNIQQDVDFSYFQKMINDDIHIFNILIQENPEFLEKRDEYSFLRSSNNNNIHKFLFDKLLEKSVLDNQINKICEEVKETTRKIQDFDNEKTILIDYYTKVEKYKWKKIFDEYIKADSSIELPKFRQKEDREFPTFSEEGKSEIRTLDYDNYDLYSKTLFDYLIDKFGHVEEKQLDDIRLKNLIMTMDKEYILAYALYQLFYPDGVDKWDKTTLFFEKNMREVFNFLYGEEKEKLYLKAAKIVANIYINHRITLEVLEEILNNRNQINIDITYFEQFHHSRISILKWLFVQNILSSDKEYISRISIPNKEDKEELRSVEGLCVKYIRTIDTFPELSKCLGLKTTMKSLLKAKPLDVRLISHDLGVVGLIYYELLLMDSTKMPIKDMFLESIKDKFLEKEKYFFMSLGIFEFFVWKLIDRDYDVLFENEHLLDAIKSEGNRVLRNKNITINEFVESIYNKLSTADFVSVGKMDIELISNKLARILIKDGLSF